MKKVWINIVEGFYVELFFWPSDREARKAREEEKKRKVGEIHLSYDLDKSAAERPATMDRTGLLDPSPPDASRALERRSRDDRKQPECARDGRVELGRTKGL